MIFTGLKDENGNIIPVQGAGTVYNEEKNSLALGKGTSAIGQDQLVFGRYNEEDADKAEIVGSSIEVESDTYYTYLELLTALQIDDSLEVNDPWNAIKMIIPANHQEHPISAVFVKKASNFQDMLTVLTAAEGKKVIYTNSEWPDYRKNSVNLFRVSLSFETESAETMWIISESTGRYFYIYFNNRGGGTQRLIFLGEMEYTDKALNRSSTVKKIEFQKTNIRTLDWQGNQWNAGDVTCDDGEGNIISLREVASREDATGKADKVASATSGNFAGLDSNGNLTDSGKKAADFADKDHVHYGIESYDDNAGGQMFIGSDQNGFGYLRLELDENDQQGSGSHEAAVIDMTNIANLRNALQTPDSVPTSASAKLITSGAVYTALQGKMEALSVLCLEFDNYDNKWEIEQTEETAFLSAVSAIQDNDSHPFIFRLTRDVNGEIIILKTIGFMSVSRDEVSAGVYDVTFRVYVNNYLFERTDRVSGGSVTTRGHMTVKSNDFIAANS